MGRVNIDLSGARGFIGPDDWDDALGRARKSFDQLRQGIGPGSEWLGWRRILREPDMSLIRQISDHATAVRENCDIYIVCGIGGSYLGTRAVIEALQGLLPDRSPTIMYAGYQLGGRYLEQLIRRLDLAVERDGSRVCMNVISKSGGTLETALAFRALRGWFWKTYGEHQSERIVVTTAPEGGVLNRLADQFGYGRYEIPEDVGGRFSVLSPVGLVPLAVAGINIKTLFEGARSAMKELEANPDPVLAYAATRYCMHQQGKVIDLIGSFEPGLAALSHWVQQLLGESEGKEGKGLFPVPVSYSTDLHSVGQMVQQGRRNLMETLLEVTAPVSAQVPGDGGPGLDGLEYLSSTSCHEINRQALEGTVEAHLDGGVPVVRIQLEEMDEETIGSLIYHYQLTTAVYVYMIEVNPFDQPGVEAYKKAMYRNLGQSVS